MLETLFGSLWLIPGIIPGNESCIMIRNWLCTHSCVLCSFHVTFSLGNCKNLQASLCMSSNRRSTQHPCCNRQHHTVQCSETLAAALALCTSNATSAFWTWATFSSERSWRSIIGCITVTSLWAHPSEQKATRDLLFFFSSYITADSYVCNISPFLSGLIQQPHRPNHRQTDVKEHLMFG